MATLDNIRIVLVEPTHPGNIGACARAMKTMGLQRLVLVAPRRFPDEEATALAAGGVDVLERAEVVGDLAAALAGCSLVVGASARQRGLSSPELDPRAGAERAVAHSARAPVALVFGRESAGLSNSELESCHYLVRIPTAADYSSLNLAAAVQVLAYELRMAALGPTAPPPGRFPPATTEELAHLHDHLQEVLLKVGFLDPANPRRLMRRLKRFLNRAQPDRNEVNILRGILTAVENGSAGRK